MVQWDLGFHVRLHGLSFFGPVALATLPSTMYCASRHEVAVVTV
jgi:hypothetical protein